MGLDMYLYGVKNYYYLNYPKKEYWSDGEEKKSYKISTEEIYWRKSNQIHNWFVEYIQQGVDDCKCYYVSKDDLKELKNKCEMVLRNPKLANQILPTTSGCFFGSTNYDGDYFYDIRYTLKHLERLLKDEDKYDWYEYESSW